MLEEIARAICRISCSEPPRATELMPAPIEGDREYGIRSVRIGRSRVRRSRRLSLTHFVLPTPSLATTSEFGRHAISIDERRGDNIMPTLWEGRQGGRAGAVPRRARRCRRWLQNRGKRTVRRGSDLDDRPDEEAGVKFADVPFVNATSNPIGIGHQPWTQLPWIGLPSGPRKFGPPLVLHLAQTVLDRIADGTLNPAYFPESLEHYIVGKAAADGVVVVPLEDPEPR